MGAVTRLCERVIFLEDGRMVKDGPAHQVVGAYLQSGLGTTAAREWPNPDEAPGGTVGRLRAVRALTDAGQVSDAMDIRCPIAVEMEYDVLQSGYTLLPHFHFQNEEGIKLFVANDLDPEWRSRPRPVGRYISRAWIPGNLLTEGTVFVHAVLSTLNPPMRQFIENDVIAFQVIDSPDGDSARGDYAGNMPGLIRPALNWETEYSADKVTS
jgi:lipopolysaccharide transport system ATP-binding protein